MINMASTGLRRFVRLDNKPIKYGLFDKFSLAVIGSCEVAKDPHIFITRSSQHIQEINLHLNLTLNHYGIILLAANQQK